MARINIVNADNKIDATPQRAYFKLKQTGGPKGEKGDTGAQGPQGATGPQGASASVVVNSTTTLPAGSDATVENIGTPQNVKLNFGIPTGAQGPQGEQGPQGAQGPQGLKGDTGAKGADGAAAKVTVGNTNTGAAGTNASVENTGSETFAVLNFTIPRGDKGETGPMPDIAQTTGQATDEVMSQKATTDALATKQNTLTAGTGITIASNTVSYDEAVIATKADLDDYAPQATTYTKTETDALLAPKLEADVVASLPATGEEGKLYLTPKNYTRSTATGNPITATVTEDAGALESFQLDGDTEQQTYIGKNLFNFRTANIRNGYLYNNALQYAQIYPDRSFILKCSPSTTYTISRSVITSSFRAAYTDTAVEDIPATSTTLQTVSCAGEINNNRGSSITITTGSNAQTLIIHYGHASTDANIIQASLESIQIEVGSTATSFEPYVGGPSPNPDYPQPIQTVTGEQTVTVVGKNLFDKDTSTRGVLNGDGTIGSSSDYFTSDFIRVVPETTYHKTQTSSARFKFYNINKTPISSVYDDIPSAGDAQSFTTPSSCYYIRFSFKYDTKSSIQIELGETATAYAPYHATTYPINLSTQSQIDMSQATRLDAYINGSGVVKTSDTNALFYIPIEANATYTITKTASSRFRYVCTSTLPATNASVGITTNNDSATSATITAGPTDTYLVCVYWASDSQKDKDTVFNSIEITEQVSIELCKLGTYQDYIWKDGDDWKVHKATATVDFYGTSGWYASGQAIKNTISGLGLAEIAGYLESSKNIPAYIESLGQDIQTPVYNGSVDNAFSIRANYSPITSSQNGILLRATGKWARASDFNTWLQTNHLTLYYALATATDTVIADTDLIAQLEAIRTAALENGANTITNSAAGSNLAGDMEIGYYGYNPRNRYDKFIWLGLNNNYEQIGE